LYDYKKVEKMEEDGQITAVERQKRNKSRVSIFVDGEYLGSVEDIVWARSGLKTGDMLKPALWEDMLVRQEAQAALDKAMKRLATRARGRVEMEKYLAEKGFSLEACKSAVEKLESYGYINDEEYAAMVVRDSMNLKPTGRRALAGDLKRLGVEEEAVTAAMEQYGEDDERAAVMRQAEKDMRRTASEGNERKRRAKVYASLARRGFSSSLINEAITKLFSDPDDE
jgi:regulatory protein